ncbi:ankyrin repeat-containing domain protein [Talaromyces proteolyticus]|uniref:Ankyrin repeat-containing domain protein n=1 Tax=Talaromyces proteolyticus TaxID=1131652 RepID=A0AAD4KKX6_9EURO|nr:ankyrin repeat-containing domain protein [Talaromyces proteolyticus]KAH8690778.1 ankyrin repeat-containing domain protein [Talaromyces proteolyticus]
MGQSDWDAHRAEIERIYLRERKSLNELRQFMESTYGFRKTKYQYEAQFKQWGFKKYRMGAENWKYVKRQIEKRTNDGKQSDVFIDGTLRSPKTVQMEIRRQGFQTAIEKYSTEPSPPGTIGVVVCSPGPSALQLLWPPNLPWFIFSKAALRSIERNCSSWHSAVNATMSNQTFSPTQKRGRAVQLINSGVTNGLSSLLAGKAVDYLRTTQCSLRVAAILSSIMPEEHQGENMLISECLCGLRGEADIMERLRVALFLVSNSFRVGDPDESSYKHRAGQGRQRRSDSVITEEDRISKQDETIMAIFYMSGLNTVQSVKRLLSTPGPTAHAISLKLWTSAVRTHDLKAIRVALRAGISPDTQVIFEDSPERPLIVAAESENPAVALQMTRLLLSYNAGSDDSEVLQEALYHATKSKNLELVDILLSRGVHVSGTTLKAAIESEIPSLLQTLLDADCDVNKRADNLLTAGYSILGIAVERNDALLVQKILGLGANVDVHQDVSFREGITSYVCWSTTLGLAAVKGNDVIIDLLLAAGADVNHESSERYYIPPLVLAVANGHKSVTKRLLEEGADVARGDATRDKTLVQRALARDDLELCRILMAEGAIVDAELMQDYYSSTLMKKVNENDVDTVSLLLSWGARVDDIHKGAPDTVLGAAISKGNCEMIEILLRAGAVNTGEKLIRIGNVQTARYLENCGRLDDILLAYGQPILVSAIKSKTDALVEFLLERGVDRQSGNIGRRPFQSVTRHDSDTSDVTCSPLAAATFWGNFPLAKILVERGASISDLELCEAVKHTNFDFIDLFLRQLVHRPCAAPNAYAKAIQYPHTAFIVDRFLDAGIDPRGKVVSNGFSSLLYLHQLHGTIDTELLESVLEQAVIWQSGRFLQTFLKVTTWTSIAKGRALTVCLRYKNTHLVQDLLNAGADVNQQISIHPTHSMPLVMAVQMQDVSLIRKLLGASADIKWIPPEHGDTILQRAVRTGNKEIVDILIAAGADVNAPASRRRGKTALQLATHDGNIELVETLLGAGADVNQEPAEEGGATALQFASIRGYIGIARKLLDEGADVNAPKSIFWGRTALEGAAEGGRIDMLQLLLNEGASVQGAGRRQYIRAIKLAEKRTHYAAAELLRSCGGWSESDELRLELELFDVQEKVAIHRQRAKEKESSESG